MIDTTIALVKPQGKVCGAAGSDPAGDSQLESQVQVSRGPALAAPPLPVLWGSTLARGRQGSNREESPVTLADKGKRWLATLMGPSATRTQKKGSNVRSMQVCNLH